MKNYIQPGRILDLALPYDRLSGEAFLIGSILAVSAISASSGDIVAGAVEGVYDVRKLLADVVAVGDKLNWNDTNKELQAATSDLDNVATVVKAASGTDQTVQVKLTPV